MTLPMTGRWRAALGLLAATGLLAAAACSGSASGGPSGSGTAATGSGPLAATPPHSSRAVSAARSSALPRPSHIVVVVEENHASAEIIGSSSAPYINALARIGASFTRSYAITHPSEPNYLALFSGSTQRLTDDSCPHTYRSPNLGSQLRAAGKSFRGYSDSLRRAGYTGCTTGDYARRHVPWTDFANLPRSVNQPFSRFASNYHRLPALSFVIPNLAHDMHDGTIAQGDTWLRQHLAKYIRWARSHNSLLVLTWDEDDSSHGNRIATVVVGAHVKAGRYRERVTHYRMLRTLEALERVGAIGNAASTRPITDIWTG